MAGNQEKGLSELDTGEAPGIQAQDSIGLINRPQGPVEQQIGNRIVLNLDGEIPEELLAMIAKYFKFEPHENLRQEKSQSRPLPAFKGVPPRHFSGLIGRHELIRNLRKGLLAKGTLALQGIPGVGKTVLAVELAYDEELRARFSEGILWAGLGRDQNVSRHLAGWLEALGVPKEDIAKMTDLEDMKFSLKTTIGTKNLLLIVDDVWQPEVAQVFMEIGGPNSARLITTRSMEVAVIFTDEPESIFVINELDIENGLLMLERLAPKALEIAPREARDLVQLVGGLPQALNLIGDYLKLHGHSRQDMIYTLGQLQKPRERLNIALPGSLTATIDLSYEALSTTSQKTLRALSILSPKPHSFSRQAALAVSDSADAELSELVNYGLLEPFKQDQSLNGQIKTESDLSDRYTIHQTIADYASIKLEENQESESVQKRMVNFFVPFVHRYRNNDRVLTLEVITNLNVISALEFSNELSMYPSMVMGITSISPFLLDRGLLGIAEELLQAAQENLDGLI